MKKSIAISVLLAGLLAASGCAPAAPTAPAARTDPAAALASSRLPSLKSVEPWPSKYGQGIVITTEHYTIRTTLSDVLILRMLPGFMEAAYEGYQSELPERIQTRTRFDVYLFATRAEWEKFSEDFAGPSASLYKQIQKGAYCLKGACIAYYIGRNETYAAIGHEGWHQFSSRHFAYRLPSWLDEGIATLFETGSYKGNEWVFDPGMNLGRLAGMKLTLDGSKVIPLRQLVAINPGEVIGGQDYTVAFYSESYSLVRFLRENNYGKRLGNYHALLLGGLHGTWDLPEEAKRIAADRNIPLTIRWNQYVGPTLFGQYIGTNWDQLQDEYLIFCRKIVYHVHVVQPPSDVEPPH
jgi:hypothetical protein